MRIRLDGTRAEVSDAVWLLRQVFVVASGSPPLPARRRRHRYRVYVDIYRPTG